MDKVLIITEHHSLQNVEYWKFINKFDIIIYGMTYIIPESEFFTYYMHTDQNSIKAATESYAFKYFNQKFSGTHIFVDACSKDDISKCINILNIKKYIIINKNQINSPDTNDHLHSLVIPFALYKNYSEIAILGISTEDKRKFHAVEYIQPHLNKLTPIENLDLWSKWLNIAKSKSIKLTTILNPDKKINIELYQ